MKNATILKYVFLFIVVIALTASWAYAEDQDSYTEPHKAIQAVDKDLQLIPVYKIGDESLYFFIKDKTNLGATVVRKGIFGWKSGMFTWGPIDLDREYVTLQGIQEHGEGLVYGLIRNGDERVVTVDGHEASMVNLSMLSPSVVKDYQLEGLYLWYVESDKNLNNQQVKLLHKDTREIIDSVDL
ncbi:aspartyl-tRNA synthetase [Rossellomorea aquimaris]|nr:aspartyl-tRNA synthetase [Rossellomorea aquimaris]WRP07231.1 aspartyl-tRNA synthetase [Rossellomorea aquimaris]